MKNIFKKLQITLLTALTCLSFNQVSLAQSETLPETQSKAEYELFTAEVLKITPADENNPESGAILSVKPMLSELKFKTLDLPTTNLSEAILSSLQPGDTILVENFKNSDQDQENYQPVDYFRNTPIIILLLIFLALVVFIARKKGVMSILALTGSFFIVFFFTINQIAAGASPVFISILTALIIIPLNFYFTHGFNRKTHAAVLSTLITLSITIIFANLFVNWSRLTGNASEETFWITQIFENVSNLRGLVIGGIMLGMVGILDDLSIGQAGIVNALLLHSKEQKIGKIYHSAMEIGRDHIASLVNTLILVYASASLPLLILFSADFHLLGNLISLELVAEEVIRTLVTSIGVILAVPITTLISIRLLQKAPVPESDGHHLHRH